MGSETGMVLWIKWMANLAKWPDFGRWLTAIFIPVNRCTTPPICTKIVYNIGFDLMEYCLFIYLFIIKLGRQLC